MLKKEHTSDKVELGEVFSQRYRIRMGMHSEVRKGWKVWKGFEKTDRKRVLSASTHSAEIS